MGTDGGNFIVNQQLLHLYIRSRWKTRRPGMSPFYLSLYSSIFLVTEANGGFVGAVPLVCLVIQLDLYLLHHPHFSMTSSQTYSKSS